LLSLRNLLAFSGIRRTAHASKIAHFRALCELIGAEPLETRVCARMPPDKVCGVVGDMTRLSRSVRLRREKVGMSEGMLGRFLFS
jgi:hypothetical protein